MKSAHKITHLAQGILIRKKGVTGKLLDVTRDDELKQYRLCGGLSRQHIEKILKVRFVSHFYGQKIQSCSSTWRGSLFNNMTCRVISLP